MKTREWKNGPPGRWNARITWYDQTNGTVKLRLQDNGEERFLTCVTEDQAERVWELFKRYFAGGKGDRLIEMMETMKAIND